MFYFNFRNIKQNYKLIKKTDSIPNLLAQENYIIANVSQNKKKYLLPKMPIFKSATICTKVRISHFLTPHLFFVLYKHSYIEKMLYNIDLLTNVLVYKIYNPSCSSTVIQYMEPSSSICSSSLCSDENVQFNVGDLVVAPLNIDRFNALQFIISDYRINPVYLSECKTIMARAEILKVSLFDYKSMVSLFKNNFLHF